MRLAKSEKDARPRSRKKSIAEKNILLSDIDEEEEDIDSFNSQKLKKTLALFESVVTKLPRGARTLNKKLLVRPFLKQFKG